MKQGFHFQYIYLIFSVGQIHDTKLSSTLFRFWHKMILNVLVNRPSSTTLHNTLYVTVSCVIHKEMRL